MPVTSLNINSIKFNNKNIVKAYNGTKLFYGSNSGGGGTGGGGSSIIPNTTHENVGDAVIYDTYTGKFELVKPIELAGYSNTSRYTPVGVVVVPGSHHIYLDSAVDANGIGAMMSVACMDPSSPDSPSTAGVFRNSDDVTLLNHSEKYVLPYYISSTAVTNPPSFTSLQVYLPSDTFTDKNYYWNSDFKYNSSASSTFGLLGYASNTNMNICNPVAFSSYPDYNNAYRHAIKAKEDCYDVVQQMYGTNPDLRTNASLITQMNAKIKNISVVCCYRYHTPGTNVGDWYLPSLFELSYYVAYFTKINQTLQLISNTYGINVGISSSPVLLSSTSYDNSGCYMINMNIGIILQGTSTTAIARAFCRI